MKFKNIYHFHVQKSGGGSLNEAFKIICKRKNRMFAGQLPPPVIKNEKVFFAHEHAPVCATPDFTFTFSSLREPVSRLFSRYKHMRALKKGWDEGRTEHINLKRYYDKILENDFEWFLGRIPKREIQHTLTIFGFPLEVAKNNFLNRLDYVLFQDTLQKDFERMCEMIEEEPFELPRFHDYRDKVFWKPTDKDIRLAKEFTKHEQEFWDFAQRWRR